MSFDYEKSVWGRLPAGARVLEVGCGAGQFIRAVKRARPDLECFACDVSSLALDVAKGLGGGVNYKLSDPDRLPFDKKEFDAVLVFDVLEHVSDAKILLKEINRVLKLGGLFYSYVPCEGDFLSVWKYLNVFSFFRRLTEKYAGHINRLSRRQWKKNIFSSGFILSSSRYSEHLFGQILNLVTFVALDNFARNHIGQQINNEYFFANLDKSRHATFLKFLKRAVNSAVYCESYALQLLPSPNWHMIW